MNKLKFILFLFFLVPFKLIGQGSNTCVGVKL